MRSITVALIVFFISNTLAAYNVTIQVAPSSTHTYGLLWMKIRSSEYKVTRAPTAIIPGKKFNFSIHEPSPMSTIDKILLKYTERDLHSNDHIKVNKITLQSNENSKSFCGNPVSSVPKELYHGLWSLFEDC